jgi:hypothetical protein
MPGFQCTICGQYHNELPMEFAAPMPDYAAAIPETERLARCKLTEDVCVIDNEAFFLRGCLEIPVHNGLSPIVWGVWVSLSAQNFEQTLDLWTTPGRENQLPYFGWLSTRLSDYPDTPNLKTLVHTRVVGERPWIELEPTDHPLAQEQRYGVSWDTAQQKIERLLHLGND